MVMPAFDHPWALLLLAAALPALAGRGEHWHGISSIAEIPIDLASTSLDVALRALSALAIVCIVLGLAGAHSGPRSIARIGHGAHIVLLLDRSLSMDEGFALTGKTAKRSKTVAASHIIEAFFARRPHDSFGLVAFSTQPIVVMNLTEHRQAMAAAMAAMAQKGLANTDIGAGLETALSLFGQDDPQASRVLLFVSDGAGDIPLAVQTRIRTQALLQRVHIYYLYLRSGDAPSLAADIAGHNDPTQPAALDAFFRSLDVPYRGFEATDPDAITAATAAIDKIETRPITYREPVPRIDYDGLCYGLAMCCLLCVLLARLAERDFMPLARAKSR